MKNLLFFLVLLTPLSSHADIVIATVLRAVGFDKKGDVTAPGYVFYEWKDGQYDYYQE